MGNITVCAVVGVDRYTAAARRRGGQAELVCGGRRIQHVLLLHVEHGNLLLLLPRQTLLSCELLLLHYFLVFPQLQYLELKGFPQITCM